MPGFWARVCGIRERSLGKRRERKGCGNPVSLGGEANEGGNKASIMRVGRHHAAAVLLSSHWLTTSLNPLAPHTFTLTYTHNQALEIPRIPSTSLTALWPRGDNKGMGRRWMPACSLDTEALPPPLLKPLDSGPYLAHPIHRYLTVLLMRWSARHIWVRHCPGSPVNPIEVKPHPAVKEALWLVPVPGPHLIPWLGQLQPYHSPLGWGFLLLSGSSCRLQCPGFPGSLASCFTSCNMPLLLLPCSGHVYYSPLESSSRQQRGIANRCTAAHSLGGFAPLMHNQDQIDDIAWTWGSRLIFRASSL